MKILSTFLVTPVLIVALVGCAPAPTRYNLTISGTEGGSVASPGEGTHTYEAGTVVDLAVEPDEGWHFDSWTGDVGTVANVSNATTTITMRSHCSITANFGRGVAIPPKNPGTFVQMMIGDIDSLDPAWVYDALSGEQVQCIYETLIFYDGERIDQFVPVLATQWEPLDDNVTYRFKIREGVKFHEGGELTPEDVEYSFERAMVQDRRGGPIWMLYESLVGLDGSRDWDTNIVVVTFDQIDNAVEVDGDWVVFHLVDPAWGLAFLQIICGPWASIVDKEWCIASGDWDGTEKTWLEYNNPDVGDSYLYDHTNGSGPWKLNEWEQGLQIKLVRNDAYWREPAVFEMVITKFVEEWASRKEALLAGDADFVYVPWVHVSELDGIDELDDIADLNVYRDLPELGIEAFFFNFDIASESEFIGSGTLDGNGIPPDFFTDIDVRKGLNYAFDWETYVSDGYAGDAEQRGSPVVEGLPFYNPDASMYSYDITKAEEHLKLAWDGEVWEKGFKFTVLYRPNVPQREVACKILAENLAAINPKFEVSMLPTTSNMTSIARSRTAPMFHIGWWLADYPHPDNFVVPFMASYEGFARWQGYGYPELDQLIEDAFKESDPAVQKSMYYEIQERYHEDAPSIMLCQPLSRRYFTKYVHGFYFNPMICSQAGPLYYMSKSSS